MLVLAECVVSVDVYLMWEAHNICRLWYLPSRVMRALKLHPLHKFWGCLINVESSYILLVSSVRTTPKYLLVQSLRYSRFITSHDWSPGRNGDSWDFAWIDSLTAEIFDGSCATLWCDQSFGNGLRAMTRRLPLIHNQGLKSKVVTSVLHLAALALKSPLRTWLLFIEVTVVRKILMSVHRGFLRVLIMKTTELLLGRLWLLVKVFMW